MDLMFNIKTIMLVTGLTSLTCQPQAWAMDDVDNTDTAASSSLSISPKHELKDPQEKNPDATTQLQMERLENEKLAAQIAAQEAEAAAAEAEAAAVRVQQELDEERLKREELEERLRAAEARKQSAQSALSAVKEAAYAPRPTSSDLPTRLGHNVSTESARAFLAVTNLVETGRLDWRGKKKKKKKK